jgi:hypothetical protein
MMRNRTDDGSGGSEFEGTVNGSAGAKAAINIKLSNGSTRTFAMSSAAAESLKAHQGHGDLIFFTTNGQQVTAVCSRGEKDTMHVTARTGDTFMLQDKSGQTRSIILDSKTANRLHVKVGSNVQVTALSATSGKIVALDLMKKHDFDKFALGAKSDVAKLDSDRRKADTDQRKLDADRAKGNASQVAIDADVAKADADRAQCDRDQAKLDNDKAKGNKAEADADQRKLDVDKHKMDSDVAKADTDKRGKKADFDVAKSNFDTDVAKVDVDQQQCDRDRQQLDVDKAKGHKAEADSDQRKLDTDKRKLDVDVANLDVKCKCHKGEEVAKADVDTNRAKKRDFGAARLDTDVAKVDVDRQKCDRDRQQLDVDKAKGHKAEADVDQHKLDIDKHKMDVDVADLDVKCGCHKGEQVAQETGGGVSPTELHGGIASTPARSTQPGVVNGGNGSVVANNGVPVRGFQPGVAPVGRGAARAPTHVLGASIGPTSGRRIAALPTRVLPVAIQPVGKRRCVWYKTGVLGASTGSYRIVGTSAAGGKPVLRKKCH